jgi:hypothetical protein
MLISATADDVRDEEAGLGSSGLLGGGSAVSIGPGWCVPHRAWRMARTAVHNCRQDAAANARALIGSPPRQVAGPFGRGGNSFDRRLADVEGQPPNPALGGTI